MRKADADYRKVLWPALVGILGTALVVLGFVLQFMTANLYAEIDKARTERDLLKQEVAVQRNESEHAKEQRIEILKKLDELIKKQETFQRWVYRRNGGGK